MHMGREFVFMKRLLVLVTALLMALSSAVLAEEISFPGIPWLSSVESVKDAMNGKLPGETPSEDYTYMGWYESDWCREGYEGSYYIPDFELVYTAHPFYDVAGLKVDSMTLKFVPEGDSGTYSDESTEGYRLVQAEYHFAEDGETSLKDVYSQLEKKMLAIYGEPSKNLSGGEAAEAYSRDTSGYIWEGDHNTKVRLYYSSTHYYNDGKSEKKVIITYSYGDWEFYKEKDNLIPASDGADDADDIGPVNGL